MQGQSKIREVIFMVLALAVPGSAIASTNLFCKADCPFQKTEVKNTAHACCPKISQKTKVTEKLSVKCDNCIESRDLPVALNPSTDLKQIEAVILYEVTNPGDATPAKATRSQKFSFDRNRSYQPKSVSITLHRFLI
jgi:hypothetical protein